MQGKIPQKYDSETVPCCLNCDKQNSTKVCKKCAVVYCKHYASVTDVRFCANCISDTQLKITIMEKTVEHERPDGTVTFSRKYQAKHMKLTGTDWLFAAALIEDMSDADIEATIEYHRANVGLMLQERESRKLERYRKLAGIQVANKLNLSQEQREKAAAKANKPTKTKVTNKELSIDDAMKMLSKLSTSGLTMEQLLAALTK